MKNDLPVQQRNSKTQLLHNTEHSAIIKNSVYKASQRTGNPWRSEASEQKPYREMAR